jgi:hypothetical protein
MMIDSSSSRRKPAQLTLPTPIMPNASHEQYSANPHFLASLSGLMARQSIVVEHSLAATDGSILLNSGQTLQDKHVQELPQQLLRSPLEASLALPDFAAHALLQKNAALAFQPTTVAGAIGKNSTSACLPCRAGESAAQSFAHHSAGHAGRTRTAGTRPAVLPDQPGLALRTGQSSILLEQIALAALFHDIGELYQTPSPGPAAMPPCGVTAWHIR